AVVDAAARERRPPCDCQGVKAGRHAGINYDDPGRIVTVDREAGSGRAVDRLDRLRVGELQGAPCERDGLRSVEDRRVERDGGTGTELIGEVDSLPEAQLARRRSGAVNVRVDDESS